MSNQNSVDDYGWESSNAPQSCNYITPVIIDFLLSEKPVNVLDLGCGNGSLCHTISTETDCNVIGVDNDEGGIQQAKNAYPNLQFYRFGVQEDPQLLIDRSGITFDVVISTEVIEHLYSPQLLPQYAHHVLKPGGKLLITTPYHGYLKNLALSIFDKWDHHHTALWEGGHIKFWSQKTITSLLEDHGFKVTHFTGTGRLPYLWKSMVVTSQKI